MSNLELPKISNPVQNLFDKVKQRIGGCPSTLSLSSTDFDVTLTPTTSFKPKRALKRKPEDEIIIITEDTEVKRAPLKSSFDETVEDQANKMKDEVDSVEIVIKDEVSDEGNDESNTTERPKPRRNRAIPTAIPPIFLNTPMLLRSELSQKKPSPIERTRVKEKLRSSTVAMAGKVVVALNNKDKAQKAPAPKLSPTKKPTTEILSEDVLFVSEEVKSQGDGDKPSLKLLIRQKRKSDPIQTESSINVEQKVEEKLEKLEKMESEENKDVIPENVFLNNNDVKENEEIKENPHPPQELPPPPSPLTIDVDTITDEVVQVTENKIIVQEETEVVEVIELPQEEPPVTEKEKEVIVIEPEPALNTTEKFVAAPTPEVPTPRKRGRPPKTQTEGDKVKATPTPERSQKITRSSRSTPIVSPKETPTKKQPHTTPKNKLSRKKSPSPSTLEVKPMVTRRSAMKAKVELKKLVRKSAPSKPKKKVENKKTKTVTRSQKKLQSKKVVEKPKKAEVKVLAKIPQLAKDKKKKVTLTVNKKQKVAPKKPKVTKTTPKKVVKVEKTPPKQDKPDETTPKDKRRSKILKPISLKSNTMLIATIVKTTLEQLSAQKKLFKKSKLKQRATLGKKEETDQAQEENKNETNEVKNETNTIDNVISQVKEILAKDPSIVNSIVEDSTSAEKTVEAATETPEEKAPVQPAPASPPKKLYSVIPDVFPRPRGRKPNCSKPKPDSPQSPSKVMLPTEVITKNEEKLINDIETLKTKCTEDLRQRPVDESKGDMGVFDFDEFDPEPEEVLPSYKVIKEASNDSEESTSGDSKTPMKQATIFEMFDRVLIKNKKANVTRSVFGHSSRETVALEQRPPPQPQEPKRKSTEAGPSMPPPPKKFAPAPDEEDVELFDDDDSRREWMPEELAEYKLKYSAKKEMGYKPIYKCKICLMVLPTYYKLYKHKEEHVKTQNPYNCKQCEASFGNVNDLVAHIRVHKGKHPYVCQKCDLGFWSKKAYDDHIPIHLLRKVKEPPKKFQCDVCGKRFPKICDIERHVRVHTGEKPFVCNICNKPFQQAHNLSKHLLIHLHLKPFSCEICGKQFGRVDVLNRHVLTHSVKKPVECWLCPKDFIRHSQLSHHVQKEHPQAMDTEIARELFGAHKRRGPVPRRLTDYESGEGEGKSEAQMVA